MISAMVLSALAPAAVEVVKSFAGGLSRKIAGLSVDDEIKLQNADIERLKVLAQLDTPSANIAPWVANLRASFRYIAAAVFVIGGIGLAYINSPWSQLGLEFASSATAFIFGERMVLSLKNK